MSRPSVRSARLAGWIAVPAALVLSGGAIAGASYSAFAAKTDNPTSTWNTGDVKLVDDDSATAMFGASNLGPGAIGTKCIVVTSQGSLASTVKMYGTGATTTKGLSSYVKLLVKVGTGGTFNDCTNFTPTATIFDGTLADFADVSTGAHDFASGRGAWTSASTTDTRTYWFQYTLDPNVANTAQGGTAAIGFTWEAQN